MPLVSIVTPCFNGEKYLERFFCSILAQTYDSIELVFVNDGSTDHTEEVVDAFRGKFEARGISFVYQVQENAGQAAALNRGLKLFTGEYMNWMDSDDEIMPEFIERKVEFMTAHPECSYCYGKAIAVNEDNPNIIINTFGKRESRGSRDFFKDILYVRNVFFSGYLVRTNALDHAIRNREIYSGTGGQNAQLLLPLAWYYGEPGYVEESVYKYYLRRNSHSHSQDTSEKVIQQLERYERILIETLERIADSEVQTYIADVKCYYARRRFGNAVDTMNSKLIGRYYRELRQLRIASLHDTALYIKYTGKSYFDKTKRE